MQEYALSAVGRDRPGIVAGITGALVKASANIEDSRMTILRGNFAVMMLVSVPDEADIAQLETDLTEVSEQLDLETVVLSEIESAADAASSLPTHVLTVYGADHPGIVHAVCSVLAGAEVNIYDLATSITGKESKPLYTLICELTLPDSLSPEQLEALLASVRDEQGVEVVLRVLEVDVI